MYSLTQKLPHQLEVGDVLALVRERGIGHETELVLSKIVKVEKEMRGWRVHFENHGAVSQHFFAGDEPALPVTVAVPF